MSSIAFSSMRVGQYYRLVNFGEKVDFQLIQILHKDYQLKDLYTLETYTMNELIKFGKGRDFELKQIRKR